MNQLPFLSGITVTYGRVACLQEAIAHFLAQDYPIARELIVLNTCPEQTLRFVRCEAGDSVIVENLTIRPKSLGAARNMAVARASGTHIVVWDDDDRYLPHHLSTIGAAFADNDWIWLERQFYSLGEEIKDIVPGACPVFSFTKKAWKEVGGYADMDVGEDRSFISRVTEKFKGAKIPVEGMPSFIYSWANEVYHISGQGESPTAHARVAEDLRKRIEKGREPTGEIWLQPQCKLDWKAKAEAFMAERNAKYSKKKPGDDVAIMLLGRFGDIINALPIAKHIAESYGKPHWIVSREFASIFDGVSYVVPVVVDLKNHQINEGLAFAKKNYQHVICAQVWGAAWAQHRECASYNRESWRVSGFGQKFDDPSWRPLFDRRDYAAEAAFYAKCNPEGKLMLVTNVRKSVSSPFKYGANVLATLRTVFPQLNVLDVADWDLPHIYDLLGLMERAVAVVSVDTSLLHLAAACDVPVIALTNPNPWQGSEVRGNWFARLPYFNFELIEDESMSSICKAVGEALTDMTPRVIAAGSTHSIRRAPPVVLREPPVHNIFHCVERHVEQNEREKVRKAVAMRSWDTLYANGSMFPVHTWDYPRNALTIGEPRNLPYLLDVIMAGLEQASDYDIICFTNDDNVLHPLLPDLLQYWVSLYDCCCSSRCEFRGSSMPGLNNKPEVFATNGRSHMGRDLFAATKRWWLSKWHEIPDFIIGCSDWDLCLCAIMRRHFGIETTRANLEQVIFPADLPRGYISHEFHPPRWAAPNYVDSSPGQLWNRKLFREWAAKHHPGLVFQPSGTL